MVRAFTNPGEEVRWETRAGKKEKAVILVML